MLKTEKESVLWDITKGVRKSKQLNAAITETVPLTTVLVADAETKITGSLGLMPFYDISDVPQDAEWSHVADNSLQDITKGTEVYDLTWIERKHIGFVVYRKWRVFANAETNLPQRIEWYEKSATDSEYTLSPVMTVEYLSDGEIQEVIKEASF
jgi:hypothetical protein